MIIEIERVLYVRIFEMQFLGKIRFRSLNSLCTLIR